MWLGALVAAHLTLRISTAVSRLFSYLCFYRASTIYRQIPTHKNKARAHSVPSPPPRTMSGNSGNSYLGQQFQVTVCNKNPSI